MNKPEIPPADAPGNFETMTRSLVPITELLAEVLLKWPDECDRAPYNNSAAVELAYHDLLNYPDKFSALAKKLIWYRDPPTHIYELIWIFEDGSILAFYDGQAYRYGEDLEDFSHQTISLGNMNLMPAYEQALKHYGFD